MYTVGAVFRSWEDPTRHRWDAESPRPLAATIWYPSSTRGHRQTVALFRTGRYAWDAPFAGGGRFPLIVVSHGTGGSAAALGWLGTRLAAAGFVVAAVNHHGNTGAEPRYALEGFAACWERAADLGMLIDRVLADEVLGPRVDADRIGAAGFSIGGYTALAVAGARLDVSRWAPYCNDSDDPICQWPPEAGLDGSPLTALESPAGTRSLERADRSYRDGRVRCAFVLAPVAASLLTEGSLAAVDVPVKVMVGSDDDQGVPALNAERLARLVPNAELEILQGVTHYTFLSEGSWRGRLVAPQFFRDPHGVRRASVHDQAATAAAAFYQRHLGQ